MTGLSLYSWFRSSYLSLPLPSFIFLLALVAPFSNFAALRYFLSRLRSGSGSGSRNGSGSATLGLAPEILGIVAVLEAVLVTLASAQLPSSPAGARTCRLERQWQLMFQHRQGAPIRRIQNALRCCGLRSTHDRAWPFPGGTHGVHACEEILSRRDSCLRPWERQAATLLAIATAIGAIGLLSKVNLTNPFPPPSQLLSKPPPPFIRQQLGGIMANDFVQAVVLVTLRIWAGNLPGAARATNRAGLPGRMIAEGRNREQVTEPFRDDVEDGEENAQSSGRRAIGRTEEQMPSHHV